LKNVSLAHVALFRKQVQLVPMIGVRHVGRVAQSFIAFFW